MTAQEYIQRQRQLLEAMNANRAKESLTIAFDLAAQIRLRISTRGEDFQGSKFSPYSKQWSENRQKRGRQIGYVDFTDTGRLWASVRPVVAKVEPTRVDVTIQATGADNNDKLRGALTTPKAKPRGNILLPSQSEIANASRANQARVQKYLVP
jgi:hypothetical protein